MSTLAQPHAHPSRLLRQPSRRARLLAALALMLLAIGCGILGASQTAPTFDQGSQSASPTR